MNHIYNLFLIIHSWNRWLILIAGIILFTSLIIALTKHKPSDTTIKVSSITFLSSLHLQLLIGLVLYLFLSPFTQAAFRDFGAAMGDSGLRFWAIEHTLLNILGVVLVQMGYSKSKRTINDKASQKTLLMWMGIGFILIILAIPMGLMGVDRPWFRF